MNAAKRTALRATTALRLASFNQWRRKEAPFDKGVPFPYSEDEINETISAAVELLSEPVEVNQFRDATKLKGNAAAMRKALEQIAEVLAVKGGPSTALCIRYEMAYQFALAALAAPPRNCDRFANVDEAAGAFCTEDNPGGEPRMYVYEAIKWMMAPAEQEGGE